ncbi:general secretory pathway protein E [gamma proteobacterium HTCC5015]|nr:general secretory pathway protein E [gamma proteobacterium HTCC5015]
MASDQAHNPNVSEALAGEEALLARPRPLPYAYAKAQGVLVRVDEDHGVHVVYRADAGLTALAELRRRYDRIESYEELETSLFDAQLAAQYEQANNNASEVMDDLGDTLDLSQVASSMPEPEDLLESQDDAPIIRLINAILTEAIKSGASDIHIEPFERELVVRMRVDGVLRKVLTPPRSIAALVISRIKVMSDMDIAEKRVPQDGRISLRVAGRNVDVRVSTLPSGHGERVVMRILDKQAGQLDLDEIGMDPNVLQRFRRLIQMPHGILLVTGPTGSGKTTTLYSALSALNSSVRNILTVEDPIEYYLDGIGQTQVNTKVDMTFARGLRAILRQDPDVVMVGEIRDLETAEIAVQASLTGHLVLSTLHTNTAVGAVTRLRDMGVEPFLLSSSIIGVLAQRLVRVLCPECCAPHEATEGELELLRMPSAEKATIYTHVGCDRCNHSGYVGRRGIYELIEINEAVRDMIHDGASESEIEREARKLTPSIHSDGRKLVLEGKTTLDEVLRVTQEV